MASNWDENADEATHVFENDDAENATVPSSERWYISADGRTKEVLEARAIIERARAGSLSDSTLVWRDGLSDWTRLDAVPELMQAVRAFRQSSPAANAQAASPSGASPSGASPSGASPSGAAEAGSEPSPANPLAVASLPPLPPVPGASPSGAAGSPAPSPAPKAPLPQPAASSLRPATVTLTGAPLPPPPSLPPKLGQSATQTTADSANATASTPVAESKSTGDIMKEKAAAAISSVPARVAEAKARISDFAQRDHQVPKIGPVKGRLILGVGGAVLASWLLASLLWGGDDDGVPSTSIAGSGEADGNVDNKVDDNANRVTPPAPSEGANSVQPSTSPSAQQEKGAAGAEVLSLADLEPAELEAFDVAAAKASLEAAAAKAGRCKSAGAPQGTGSVRVKIEPNGKVSEVSLMSKEFQGTEASGCIEKAFRQASVPAFSGEAKTVFKKFTIR